MRLSPWLWGIRGRLKLSTRRPQRHRLLAQAEILEDRTLLSVTAILIGNDLTVSSDDDDSIRVSSSGGTVVVESAAPGGVFTAVGSLPAVNASTLETLVVTGSSAANTIDLSGVTSAFSSLNSIRIEGGTGDDIITGSPTLADNIVGGDGADQLFGLGGDDTIDGGNGADLIDGGDGNDSLIGEDGKDIVTGGGGNDTIVGGDGRDTLSGGAGDDSIGGGSSSDLLTGGDGDDTIVGDSSSDTLQGGNGNDLLQGGSSDDVIAGGDGNDTLDGESGNDTLDGDSGNDVLSGGNDNDVMRGGDGNDFLNGNGSDDDMQGGAGNDTLYGGSGDDFIRGEGGSDEIRGHAGADTILGGGGSDYMDGGSGNDLIRSENQTLTVGDVTLNAEGDTGTTGVVFTVNLAEAVADVVTVDFTTSDGSATAGVDYVGTSGTLTFQPGDIMRSVTVQVIGDLLIESNETFFFTIANAINAPISVNQAMARIIDDDGEPLSVDDVIIQAEGDSGSTNAVFTVTLAAPSTFTVTVDFATNDQSATAGADYQSTIGTLTFAPGQTTQTFTVPVFGDTINEANEVFNVRLSNPVNAFLGDSVGNGTIIDDDGTALTIDDITVDPEGNSGTTNAVFTVSLSALSGQVISVDYSTASGTATAGSDYVDSSGTVTFQPGQLTQSIIIPVIGDTVDEAAREDFFVNLSNSVNAPIADPQGRGEIVDDEGSNFDIVVTFSGGLTPSQQAVFTAAERRWERIIIGDVPDVMVAGIGLVDDVVIDASGAAIDGVGGILGQAGPRSFRSGTFLPSSGRMQFDTADLSNLESSGGLTDVILHEMGHVLGIGTIWRFLNLLNGAGSSDPRFTGSQARTEHNNLFSVNESGVPVANTGGGGTRDAHWRESVYRNELMSGFLNQGVNPISRVTVASLADIGYQVDFSAADTFQPGQSSSSAPTGDGSSIAALLSLLEPTTGSTLQGTDDTLLGGDGNDTLLAGNNNDSLNGGTGHDSMNGGGGRDTLIGGADDDAVNGGDGDDTLSGGTGNDALDGGNGDDILDGESGDDMISGGGNNDIFVWRGGDDGSDEFSNTSGFDTVQVLGDASNNQFGIQQGRGRLQITQNGAILTIAGQIMRVDVDAGDGDDSFVIEDLSDVPTILLNLNGQGGNDTFDGSGASLERVRLAMNGGDGDDVLTGSDGNDTLDGGDGDDKLSGLGGNDTINGGAGNDVLSGGSGNDNLAGGDGDDSLMGESGNDVVLGGDGNDFSNGGVGDDALDGGIGRDTLNGASGNDSIAGGTGRDTLFGGSGADTLDGGEDDDSLKGHSGDDRLRGGDGNDILRAGSGNDWLNGGDGNDVLRGDSGNDGLTGNDGNDFLDGSSGDDTIVGGDGDDSLLGGSGRDIALGGNGNDRVNGQGNTDTIAGGEGDDFLVGPASEIDEAFQLADSVIAALDAT